MIPDLQEVLTRESEQVEWKENVADFRDVVRTLVAFANDLANLGGGRVVCGAKEEKDDDGFPRVRELGLTAARFKEIEGEVVAWCRNRVHPPLVPVVDERPGPDPSRRILVFTIVATGHAHALRDDKGTHYWVRSSRNTIEARNGVLLRLQSAKGQVEPWDRRIAANVSVDELDLLALRDTLVRLRRWDPTQGVQHWLDPDISLSAFMPSLCAREPGSGLVRPRNFAVLLFGRNPQRHVPGAVATFSLYPGSDRSEPYAERLELDGTILSQAFRLVARLNVEATTLMDKSSGAPQNVVRFPEEALKEAVVNAIVHRDYTVDHPTRVVAYADRIEIWSPGGLTPGMRPEKFEQGDAPVWRNRSLAWIFGRLNLAQAEGQGIPTIIRSMQQEGCPPPRFALSEDSVTCILPAHPRHARMRDLQKIEQDISLGRISEATQALERLLSDDPYNFRTIALLTELARSTQDDSAVVRFALRHHAELHRLPAAAQLSLADALTASRGIDPQERGNLVRELLRLAGQGRMELGDARRLIIAHLAVQDEQEALAAVERMLHDHPEWNQDPALLQLRGRTWLQFAKRCKRTLAKRTLTPLLRSNAERDLGGFLERAERDLRASLAHGAAGIVRLHAEDDLRFLASLRPRPPRG
jgi:ATP-dependent DNA helicase RecG